MYYTICTFNVRITIFVESLICRYCKVPFANAVLKFLQIAVKAVCSEVNLPVPTAWPNKRCCCRSKAATFWSSFVIKAASVEHKL
jgi:hypothetical protein